jgi:uncharacterized membrane protein YbaN (DUF454 family)
METPSEQMEYTTTITNRKWLSRLFIAAGTVCVGLGALGILLPVLPTTPFLLLAAACYARSSPRFYNWLLTNKWFGTYIGNYRRKRGMPLKLKLSTVALTWLTIGLSMALAVHSLPLRLLLAAVALGVTVHIMSIKTMKE